MNSLIGFLALCALLAGLLFLALEQNLLHQIEALGCLLISAILIGAWAVCDQIGLLRGDLARRAGETTKPTLQTSPRR
jgi:hypothetical protein